MSRRSKKFVGAVTVPVMALSLVAQPAAAAATSTESTTARPGDAAVHSRTWCDSIPVPVLPWAAAAVSNSPLGALVDDQRSRWCGLGGAPVAGSADTDGGLFAAGLLGTVTVGAVLLWLTSQLSGMTSSDTGSSDKDATPHGDETTEPVASSTATVTPAPVTVVETAAPATVTSTVSPDNVVVTSTPAAVTVTKTAEPETVTATTTPAAVTATVAAQPVTVTKTAEPETVTATSTPAAVTATVAAQPVTVTKTAEPETVTETVTPAAVTVTKTAEPQTVTQTVTPAAVTTVATAAPETVTETTTPAAVTTVATAAPETVTETTTVDAVTTTATVAPETVTATTTPAAVTTTKTVEPSTVTVTTTPAAVTTTATAEPSTVTVTTTPPTVTVTKTAEAPTKVVTTTPTTTTSSSTSSTTTTTTTTSSSTTSTTSTSKSAPAKPLTPKQKSVQKLKDQLARANRLIPLMGAYGAALKPVLPRFQTIADHPERYQQSGIDSQTAQLKSFIDSYARAAGVDESSGKSAEDSARDTLREEITKLKALKDQARSQEIRDNVDVAIARIQKIIDKKDATLVELKGEKYRADQDVKNTTSKVDTEKKARDAFEAERAKKQKELDDRAVTPFSNDGEHQAIAPEEVGKLAKLIQDTLPAARTLPDKKTGFTDADADPEYDKYQTVEEVLGGLDSAAYKKATALTDKIRKAVRAEEDAGKGDFTDSNPEHWVQYTVSPEDVETLKPLMKLNDRYTKRMVANVNVLRKKLGLEPYTIPPLTDEQKAQMIVHSIAEYEQGIRIMEKKSNSGHTRTKAVKLVPHAEANGWNENYFGSYNQPYTARRLTPELAADEFFTLALDEAQHYAKNPDDLQGAGHFLNDIEFDMRYMYGSMFIGDVKENDNGTKTYRLSMTDLFYKLKK